MDAPLDLRRLHELRELDGMTPETWEQLARGVGASLLRCEQRIGEAFARGDLRDVAQAAHLARNDALMLGAAQLNQDLGAIERAARDGRAEDLHARVAAIRSALAATVAELENALDMRTKPSSESAEIP